MEQLYRIVKLTEETMPKKSGEYFGLLNNVEKCFISIQGGKIVKVKFYNNAQFSDEFRDMLSLDLSIYEPIEESEQYELWENLQDIINDHFNGDSIISSACIELLSSKYHLIKK